MKWPVVRLEARFKASFKRLFRTKYSDRKKVKSSMAAIPTDSSFNKHEICCAKCKSSEPVRRRSYDQQSLQSMTEFRESSPVRLYLPESCGLMNEIYEGKASDTIITSKCHPIHGKEPFKSDASVNTDSNAISRFRDAYSQAKLDELPGPSTFNHSDSIEKATGSEPLMKNVATDTTALETACNPQRTVLSNDCSLNNLQRNPTSEHLHSVSLSSRHYSDPFLFENAKLSNRTTEGIDEDYVYGNESGLRYANSSTGCLDCIVESSNYPAQWSCESRVSQNHFIAHENYVELTPCAERNGFDYTRSLYESPHSSIPRVNWYNPINPAQNCYRTHSKEDIESTASGGRYVSGEVCIPSMPLDGERSAQLTKVTKECGDECLQSIARNETSCSMKIRHEIDNTDYPVACTIFADEGTNRAPRDGSTQRGIVRRQRYTNRSQASTPIQGRCTLDQLKLEDPDLTADSLGDRYTCKSQTRRQGNISGSRPIPLKSVKKESRPSTAHSVMSNRGKDIQSRRVENNQMIHHNCTMVSKDMSSQRSERSDTSTRKYALFPQSTSDDGDASKVGRRERSVDRSSASSLHSRATHLSRTSTQQQSKRSISKSPSLIKKSQKQGGALPASRDLHQCPTGRHSDVNIDKPCICMMVKRMVLEQSKPVLYSWHIKSQKPVNGHRVSVINYSKHSEDTDCRNGTPISYTTKMNSPTLPNFQLARPTRMVRGGQGTVVWVTNVTTGHFYALKFKQREGRSESTWAIERREAKLLRYARHDFIVRLYHIYETAETLFMALEWLDGGCLWNHIARSGTMPECYAIYFAACILTALRYLHKQCIVYRDMKAENVVLDQRGRPKLIDFGMAKRFDKPTATAGSHESMMDESLIDSDDFDQPPTRYYFAAYLAPEIYDHSQLTNQYIDSWGLGYIVVEMLLGYGIFLPMPWEKEPGQHLSDTWKLTLPNEAASRLSPICDDFVHKMLLRKPETRMNLTEAETHTLFARVPWANLNTIRGPDLSKCPPKGSTSTRAASTATNSTRRWLPKNDSFVHVPDLAFVREFYGCAANPSVLYSTQTFGFSSRRTRNARTQQLKGSSTASDGRSSATDAEQHRPTTGINRNRNILGNAVEIRGAQQVGNELKRDHGKINRTSRRTGVPAV